MKLINREEWKDIKFENEDAKSSSVLIVAKTEPVPFRGFYVRRWDHPYEPNFETSTYNMLEFCQQDKVRKYFDRGKAGILLVWTRDEKNKQPYFLGAYEGIGKLRRVEGMKVNRWEPRTALIAAETYVLPYERRVPMKAFESDFRKRNLYYPSEKRICPYQSRYGHYVIDRDLTAAIIKAIKENGVKSLVYADLAESHTKEMLAKQREMSRRNRMGTKKASVARFRKRFVTREDLEYARKMGIL